MSDVTDRALTLASQGFPVFPCKSNKHPCTERGFQDASKDPATIARMFADPAASLIGVPTGAMSGIDVIDIDPDKGGSRWMFENQHRLANTRTHRTRSGGFHIIFKHRAGVRSSTSSIAPGVDVRGDGGYIIWWPAAGVENV